MSKTQRITKLEKELDARNAIIEQLLEANALFQIELEDQSYEQQIIETNNHFLLDCVERLSTQLTLSEYLSKR